MKRFTVLLATAFLAMNANAQLPGKITGSYISIDSTSSAYEKDGKAFKDIDTTLLTLNGNNTFTYKWSPTAAPGAHGTLVTTGTWKVANGKILLNSKYQEDEYRVFESYRPEFGDSIVKVMVQTYDSLPGFFEKQQIAVMKDTTKDSQAISRDKDYPNSACSAVFHFTYVDRIVFYGDFGQMPAIVPKNKKSNFFLVQYNLSTNYEYQYFKDTKLTIAGKKAILPGEDDEKIVLTRL